ncbi:AGE family epimerase/isomerase [Salinicoccus sp. ID82-1]|uniref:AGE family epimerase/isomerase n=1 Tax=Salinicoccus sp. ID82-1 TaxID=2820269 RepID=UPI001F3A255D|nr:AGE family epimerase/isomerase [Salinicoccus sp. ID82-1]MCG1008816.1 AGE family epimerase/isomerase [Salinicoccus sp. ID82-1]
MEHADNQAINFRDQAELKEQIFKILDFYYPACIDHDKGGYINGFLNDGTINDTTTKHLVATNRYIYIFSIGAILGGPDWCLESARHGIRFLKAHHMDHDNNGYFFELDGTAVNDDRKMAYGHAFTLLASAIAYEAGIEEAKSILDNVYEVLETYFWDPEHALYKDEWDAGWNTVSSYRGQNPNMHLCEAMLTAYEATGEQKYLDRAYTLAESVTQKLLERSGGMIWENYTPDWQPDFEFNKNNTKDEFRPYGFVPGHQLEWSKLLMWLDRHRSEPWMLETSEDLFHKGWELGYDPKHGGILFALSPEREVIDDDKNYWVMAEAISAASLLAAKTDRTFYWDVYDQLCQYSSEYLMDHEHGGWYKLLNRQNKPYSNVKTKPPKTDYHPVAAYYQSILAFR